MFSLSNESKTVKTVVAVLLVFMLGGCLFASLYYNDELLLGSFETFDNDDVKYLRSAHTLLKTGKLTYANEGRKTVFIMPGIVLFLVPFVALFGMEGAVIPVRIVYALLQTVNLYLVFIIARKIWGTKPAVITMLMSVLYLPNIYVSAVILTEPVACLALLCLVCMIIRGTETKRKRYFISGGIVWAVSVMFRSIMAAFPVVVLLYWIFKKFKFKEILKFALCASIPFVIILSSWVIRNAVVFKRFIPLTLASGNPKLQGTIIDYSEEEKLRMFDVVNAKEIDYGDTEISMDAAENEIASRIFSYNIKNNTAEYIKWYTIGKTVKNFEKPYIWYPIFFSSYKPINIYHSVIIGAFLVAVFYTLLRRKMSAEKGLLLVTILFFNCVHLPFYCFARYVYPVMCFIIMFGSDMMCNVWGFIINKFKQG